MHNGVIAGFEVMRRELMLAVAPELFADIKGSTDSEVLFHLALTFGLEHDPVGALEQAIGLVEATAAKHGIENAVQASMGVADGERLWAFRYSTERKSRTLFVSAEADAVHALYPDNERLQRFRDEDRIVVSEPLADLPGVWHEIPESTVHDRPARARRAAAVQRRRPQQQRVQPARDADQLGRAAGRDQRARDVGRGRSRRRRGGCSGARRAGRRRPRSRRRSSAAGPSGPACRRSVAPRASTGPWISSSGRPSSGVRTSPSRSASSRAVPLGTSGFVALA